MTTKRKRKQALYSGGNGASLETAIIIGAKSTAAGISAEYDYIIGKHGPANVGWKLISQRLRESAGSHYDIMNIELNNGEKRSYYFDITRFFCK
jgi:hypothetical protein